MNNLHRELAPITASVWAEIEEEATRTFGRHVAGRRVVDVTDPAGPALDAVGTGHLAAAPSIAVGVLTHTRVSLPVVELRVPFTLARSAIEDVERGARDSDWQPVKDAAKRIAFAEDRAIFEGYAAANITGLRDGASNDPMALPVDPRDYPQAVSEAVGALRLAGVNGPYSLVLSADSFTAISETADHGYPIHEHLTRVLDGDIVWAPAIEGAFLLTTRGGDYELHLGQDLSIGYLSHDATSVELYFQESLTFSMYTGEAVVPFAPSSQS